MCFQQERQAKELYQSCCASGHELLLEIIPPVDSPLDDTTIASILTRFYKLNIRPDWWKLPLMSRTAWQKVSDVIKTRAPHCRGIVLLGLDAPTEDLRAGFKTSAEFDICKGFTVGRTLFAKPSRQWLSDQIDDQQLIDAIAANYVELIGHWRDRKAI